MDPISMLMGMPGGMMQRAGYTFAGPAGTKQITPKISSYWTNRVRNADSDEEMSHIVHHLWENYGVDWSHLLEGMK